MAVADALIVVPTLVLSLRMGPSIVISYDGNVGCVGSDVEQVIGTLSLNHVGNVAFISEFQSQRYMLFPPQFRWSNVGNVGWFSPL